MEVPVMDGSLAGALEVVETEVHTPKGVATSSGAAPVTGEMLPDYLSCVGQEGGCLQASLLQSPYIPALSPYQI